MRRKPIRPVIGITPLWDEEKKSLWMLPGYLEGLRAAGAIPLILPLTDSPEEIHQLLKFCDGILLTGGQDVDPAIYGEEPLEGKTDYCPDRDAMEKQVLTEALRKDLPLLGICRGLQFINAALGGSLYQDLPTQYTSEIDHHQTPPYDVPAHQVHILAESPLALSLGDCLPPDGILAVNSYHHQAVKQLAPELKAMAESTDGLIEAFYHPDRNFLWAVQWHPEFDYQTNAASQRIFKAFVNAF